MNTEQKQGSTGENTRIGNDRSLGVLLLVLPPVLMVFLYGVLQMINGAQAAQSIALNQGGMVTLFFVLVAGAIISMVVMVIGLAKILRTTRK
jgi:hypothetical protein